MLERRVVVTGMGMVSPLGLDVQTSWQNLLDGKLGITESSVYPPIHVAAEVKDFQTNMSVTDARRAARPVQFAVAASDEALKNAGLLQDDLQIINGVDRTRFGVRIGTGMGGAAHTADVARLLDHEQRVTTQMAMMLLPERVSTVPSMRYGLMGPLEVPSAACATGNVAIVGGYEKIKTNQADLMLVGGTESLIKPEPLAGFDAIRALSQEEDPSQASLPFNNRRSGFVMGEGAGVLVLEEYVHAKEREATIFAELVGFSQMSDGAPGGDTSTSVEGLTRAMMSARKNARPVLHQGAIYINAHATGTPAGDPVEVMAIKNVYQDEIERVRISSTKGHTGHLLGGAGAVEAIFSVMALNENVMPPTLGLDDPVDEAKGIHMITEEPIVERVGSVVNNSFGFGRINCVTIFQRV